MAFNFELKMLIAPLGIAGSFKLQRECDPPASKCGSKQSFLVTGGNAQLEAPSGLGASLLHSNESYEDQSDVKK